MSILRLYREQILTSLGKHFAKLWQIILSLSVPTRPSLVKIPPKQLLNLNLYASKTTVMIRFVLLWESMIMSLVLILRMMQVSLYLPLDTGANNTYVNDRRLISNLTSASASVEVADGSHHPILASGTLVNHPSIPAHFVPSFKNNLLGISPIIDSGAVGIIKSDKMTLVKTSPLVDKILNFILQYSNDNNLIILTGNKSNDLYITNLNPPIASLSVDSRHFPSIKELVYYFYIVFNCPNVDTYCHLLSIPTVSGFPPHLTAKNVRKHYPYNDKIRSQSQQSKKQFIHLLIHVNNVPFVVRLLS